MKPSRLVLALLLFAGLSAISARPSTAQQPEWPAVTPENKPWTRWWWQGSAVNEEEISAAMAAYREAGLGGLEITPIYGVRGYEDRFIDYLSDEWVAMLAHALAEAERLGLGIDVATGTGWPFGGPWVPAEDAAKYVAHETYELAGGERLNEPVVYVQEPFVRAVRGRLNVEELVEPIADNPDLQALAIDQVRFAKELPLRALMAYSDAGAVLDLTDQVDEDGNLDWVAPAGDWTLYAVFQGWHGKMVERAAPGGEGYVIDHFSEEALDHYLERFDEAFAGHDVSGVRAFFNDSYEVDDARGEANWTPEFFEAFEERRGYDLRENLPALFGEDTEENNVRVRTDYRETLGDLVLDAFTEEWREWAHEQDAVARNQSHGSPANILDLYAASDIPETEGTEILRAKFASSAAHVTGKRLTSAESATWLNEHFLSSWADVKRTLDRFFLGGVNHVFYHGTNYSPRGEDWPGWLFYAAVHFTPANPLWDDFAALNTYVARVQSFLQAGRPDNDVLLYFPIYDRYAAQGNESIRHFDGVGEEFEETTFNEDAAHLQERGYAFDFISDRIIDELEAEEGAIRTGGVRYRTIVVPESRFIPLETFEELVDLAEDGATVIAHGGLPADVPGLGGLEERQAAFRQLIGRLDFSDTSTVGVREAGVGDGRFLLGDDLEQLLSYAGVDREPMVDDGLQFVRLSHEDGATYFISNWTDDAVDGWVPLAVEAQSAAIFDPMTGASGFADVRPSEDGGIEAYVQLAPGASWIVQTYAEAETGRPYAYYRPAGSPQEIEGTWTVRFVSGGPERPAAVERTELGSWTDFGGEAVDKFSGTATYAVTFPRPEGDADAWLLDLGEVHESARVRLNGQALDTLIGPAYRLRLDDSLLRARNVLEIDVTNLMANRIADLDRRQVAWKKFYNINMSARLGENRNEQGLFDASKWSPQPSGLIGPVTLTPIEEF